MVIVKVTKNILTLDPLLVPESAPISDLQMSKLQLPLQFCDAADYLIYSTVSGPDGDIVKYTSSGHLRSGQKQGIIII